jgi:hypothetical protein
MPGYSLSWSMRCKSAFHSQPSIRDASRSLQAFPCTLPLLDLFTEHQKANESSYDLQGDLTALVDKDVDSWYGTSHTILDIVVEKKRRLSWFLRQIFISRKVFT